jgi:hypothetical protein
LIPSRKNGLSIQTNRRFLYGPLAAVLVGGGLTVVSAPTLASAEVQVPTTFSSPGVIIPSAGLHSHLRADLGDDDEGSDPFSVLSTEGGLGIGNVLGGSTDDDSDSDDSDGSDDGDEPGPHGRPGLNIVGSTGPAGVAGATGPTGP